MKNTYFRFQPFWMYMILFMVFLPMPVKAETHEVSVRNNFFEPNDITINVGDTVRWTNNSGFHDVTADDGSFASQTSSNFTYSETFTSVEEILYHCSVHSSPGLNINTNMNGRINVIATSSVDVSVESVDAVDGSYEAGEDFRVMASLRNNSNESSGVFNLRFYASVDTDITSGDILLDTKEISSISAGSSEMVDESVDLPDGMTAGDYFIGAIIDIDDTNPGNNTNADTTPIFVFTEFVMNAGLNDAWFNPVTDGQGFFITVFSELGFVNVAWFTYDTELPPVDAVSNLGDPGHRWFLAGGLYEKDQATLQIEFTSGGIFDTASEIQRTDPPGSDGTLLLKFESCTSGTVEYDITSINEQGTVPIRRVVNDNVALCDALLKESVQAQ